MSPDPTDTPDVARSGAHDPHVGSPDAATAHSPDALRAEVERLTGSLEIALERLTQSGHPEDVVRFARLHVEAALAGRSRPLVLVLSRAEAAEAESARLASVVEALADEANRAATAYWAQDSTYLTHATVWTEVAHRLSKSLRLASVAPEPTPNTGEWDMRSGSMCFDREEWGVIIDALIQHRGHAEQRKAVNSESTSDVRADMCADLIGRIRLAALASVVVSGSADDRREANASQAPDTATSGEATEPETDWQGLLSMVWTGDTTYPFTEDENANITGYGHQDKAAFASAVNAYDEDCNGGPIPEEDQWSADSIAHQWVLPDADDERLHPVVEGTPDAIPVTTLWGQR